MRINWVTSDLDLVKLDEETLREDLLLMDMKRRTLTTLSPSRLRRRGEGVDNGGGGGGDRGGIKLIFFFKIKIMGTN